MSSWIQLIPESFFIDGVDVSRKIISCEINHIYGTAIATGTMKGAIKGMDDLVELAENSTVDVYRRFQLTAVNTMGLKYSTDHNGAAICILPANTHENGSLELVFSVMAALPDLSAYFTEDTFLEGVKLTNNDLDWVTLGLKWIAATNKYYYAARAYSYLDNEPTVVELVSTTEVAVGEVRRITLTWEED